jgi:hypothetical protein
MIREIAAHMIPRCRGSPSPEKIITRRHRQERATVPRDITTGSDVMTRQ